MIEDLDVQIKNHCRFCNPKEPDRILYQSKNFYVMLSLGPIVEGYTLLVSKNHIGCCGELKEDIFDEFIFLYNKTKEILNKEYGGCIAYEHGKAGSCLIPVEGSKHCFHSHMHFIPIDLQINSLINDDFNKSISFNSLNEFRSYLEKNKTPYLYADDSTIKIYPNIYEVRSQYLRHKTATAIGKDDLWDWVKHQGWDKIITAKKRLKPKFAF